MTGDHLGEVVGTLDNQVECFIAGANLDFYRVERIFKTNSKVLSTFLIGQPN